MCRDCYMSYMGGMGYMSYMGGMGYMSYMS